MLWDLDECIELFRHPFFEDEAVGHGKEVLWCGFEVVPREEDPLFVAARTVDHHWISLFEGIQGLLEMDIVLWVFAELGLLGLSGVGIQLVVILLNILFGRWWDWEFPLIGSGIY